MQDLVTTVEVHGSSHPETPILANGMPLVEGRSLTRFGVDAQVTRRLLRMLVLLALRRVGGSRDGWTEADELALLVDDGGTADATRQLFARILRPTSASRRASTSCEPTRCRRATSCSTRPSGSSPARQADVGAVAAAGLIG